MHAAALGEHMQQWVRCGYSDQEFASLDAVLMHVYSTSIKSLASFELHACSSKSRTASSAALAPSTAVYAPARQAHAPHSCSQHDAAAMHGSAVAFNPSEAVRYLHDPDIMSLNEAPVTGGAAVQRESTGTGGKASEPSPSGGALAASHTPARGADDSKPSNLSSATEMCEPGGRKGDIIAASPTALAVAFESDPITQLSTSEAVQQLLNAANCIIPSTVRSEDAWDAMRRLLPRGGQEGGCEMRNNNTHGSYMQRLSPLATTPVSQGDALSGRTAAVPAAPHASSGAVAAAHADVPVLSHARLTSLLAYAFPVGPGMSRAAAIPGGSLPYTRPHLGGDQRAVLTQAVHASMPQTAISGSGAERGEAQYAAGELSPVACMQHPQNSLNGYESAPKFDGVNIHSASDASCFSASRLSDYVTSPNVASAPHRLASAPHKSSFLAPLSVGADAVTTHGPIVSGSEIAAGHLLCSTSVAAENETEAEEDAVVAAALLKTWVLTLQQFKAPTSCDNLETTQ